MSSPPKKSDIETGGPVLESPAYDGKAAAARERERKKQKTDFRSLKRELGPGERRREKKTITDYLIDGFVPFVIFWLVVSVMFFLLDVRFIYTAVEHVSLRIFAFSLILGVVALNRLIATDNTGDSGIYVAVLAMLTALYTGVTSTAYDVGSIGGKLLNTPGWAIVLNMTVVSFVWWVTNRLVYECCINENRSAGEIGVLTGTVRNLRRSLANMNTQRPQKAWKDDYLLPSIEIQAFDPHDFKPGEKKAAPPAKATERLSRRHPGVSIFYFAVPAMAIFSLGLPVLMRGGRAFVMAGHAYVATFTISALVLLLLTSLGGIRAYFRARRVTLPANLGVFWMSLGLFLVLVVVLGALRLPLPAMPRPAYVEEHEHDPWSTVGQRFELTPMASTAADQIQQSRVIEYTGQVVLVVLLVFALYSALRVVTIIAADVGARAYAYPRWLVWVFRWLDRILEKIVSLPQARPYDSYARPSAANAASTRFRNPMAGEGAEARGEEVQRYVAHAFDALCALGQDLGRPRRKDETPYEFLKHLPRELAPLKREAGDVVEWYVRSAYSQLPPDATILDRLRKFWFEYERLRKRYIR